MKINNMNFYMSDIIARIRSRSLSENTQNTQSSGSSFQKQLFFAMEGSNNYNGSGIGGTGGVSSSPGNTNDSLSQDMDTIFREASQTYGVSVDLLKAVAKAESNFNANAVSSAGAMGVMQLMPATAQGLGVTDPFDARSNIFGGAKYLAQKLNQYNGDVELALAAYNAGSGNVAKYGGIPPFKETQNYVKKVIGYMGSSTAVTNTTSRYTDAAGQALKNYLLA